MSTGTSPADLDNVIRQIVAPHARVSSPAGLRDDDDLFRAGMTSHATVSVMLALEDAFGVEFPDDMLQRSTFASVSAIRAAVSELLA